MASIVIDTNVLVRLLVGDDAAQFETAKQSIGRNEVWISITALLETEWVLRSRYQYAAPQIARVFSALINSAEVRVEDENHVQRALAWYAAKSDFADALHLARTESVGELLTFDRDFCKPGRRSGARVRVLRTV